MKVKIGQLKTHLSGYLRKLQADGEPIEVCVRETTVAYMSAVSPGGRPTEVSREESRVKDLLRSAGLRWDGAPAGDAESFHPAPIRAGDARHDIDSIESIRSGRNW